MRFYTGQHAFYCGIDLHARVMYLFVMDQGGEILLHKNLPADPDVFLKAIASYRSDTIVAVVLDRRSVWQGRDPLREDRGPSARRDATHGLHLPPDHALHPGPAGAVDHRSADRAQRLRHTQRKAALRSKEVL